MKDKPDITVVVPVFNASSTLQELCERSILSLNSANLNFEIILIDDGSRDDSWQIIHQLKCKYPDSIAGFQLAKNAGQQVATLCGIQHARGTWIATLDDDLQIDPEDILKLWDGTKSERVDLIYGYYPQSNHHWARNSGSRVFHKLQHMVAPDCPKGSSFRLIRSEIFQSATLQLGPWIFIDPVLSWLSASTISIPVNHKKKNIGKSGYTFLKLLRLGCQVLIIYSDKPFRLIIRFSLLSSFFTFGMGVYFLIRKITVGAPLGFSALIVAISFSSSMILLCLGVLGEYVYRIYSMKTGRPAFTVKNNL